MKKWLRQFATEDWIIVFAGAVILALAIAFPTLMPEMPKTLSSTQDWLSALYMFLFVLVLTYITSAALRRPLKGIFLSLLVIFVLTLAAQLLASIPAVKELGFESVFFAVILGLIVSNVFKVPDWLRPAIQSEFYIKIGIICLGSTILFKEVLESGIFGLAQSLIVVFTVWYFAFWVGKKMNVDPEMRTMLSSAVSICGVSAAIATCGVIKGDNKKLSYVISLVLIIAIPMMYLLPWLSGLMGLNEEVAGAWLGGTIDTTGAVAASGTLIGDTAAKTAVIVKSSQNVLLGVAAFVISLLWSYRGTNHVERPTAGVIWERFPKFVVGFILASLVFSFCMDEPTAKAVGTVTKGFQNTLFSIAFVCIGLETRFSEIFGKENRKPLYVFLIAQGFNIVFTLLIAWIMFGLVKPLF
ncbi:MAG: putative sulfate exporter family transporter [Bacteroidetes bacterium]|uniref:Sulfate exporter family transporter n=1 Tax=Candidatus Cryptobacteroides intestinigallinarum TaxID=2840767 RepID=A0A9D9HLG8_9BACT|nr:putative sulfate exporter family transporter [Candidatus Cryptobacteroides intestinigallinarum]